MAAGSGELHTSNRVLPGTVFSFSPFHCTSPQGHLRRPQRGPPEGIAIVSCEQAVVVGFSRVFNF